MAFLRRWPEVVRTSLWSCLRQPLQVDALRSARGWPRRPCRPRRRVRRARPSRTCGRGRGSSSRRARSRAASARLECLDLVARPGARPRLSALGLDLRRSRSASSGRVAAAGPGPRSRASTRASSSASVAWISVLTRSISSLAAFVRRVRAALSASSPAATMTSPVGSKTIGLGAALPGGARWPPRQRCCASTSSAVRVARCSSSSARRASRAARSARRGGDGSSARSWSSSSARASAALAAAALGLLLELAQQARWRASSSTHVTMYRAK